MTRIGFKAAGFCIALVQLAATPAFAAGAPADFEEVYELIRTRAAGVTQSELERAAVAGLVNELQPRVQLVTNSAASSEQGNAGLNSSLFESSIFYVRIQAVEAPLPQALKEQVRQQNATNKLSGVVLDLRYANGTDYKAAAETAGLFIANQQPLLKWADQSASAGMSDAIQLPLAILVNRDTSGAAEALAAALRSAGVGLVLGNRTAGEAFVVRDFPLKNGSILRLAADEVSLANGSVIGTNGVKPDIDVTVTPAEERVYYADAFAILPTAGAAGTNGSSTNLVAGRRARFGEAELVREHRAGFRRGIAESPRAGEQAGQQEVPEHPIVNDPALARALDLLKGLAVVRQSRL